MQNLKHAGKEELVATIQRLVEEGKLKETDMAEALARTEPPSTTKRVVEHVHTIFCKLPHDPTEVGYCEFITERGTEGEWTRPAHAKWTGRVRELFAKHGEVEFREALVTASSTLQSFTEEDLPRILLLAILQSRLSFSNVLPELALWAKEDGRLIE